MSDIQRAHSVIQGDVTVTNGDVIVTNPANGIVMEDNVGDTNRLTIIDDAGVKTIEVTNIP